MVDGCSLILRRCSFAAVAMLCLALLFGSCEKHRLVVKKTNQADSLLGAAYKAHNYERLLTLADSLEGVGDISNLKANYWRGYVCFRQKRLRMAELYWKRAMETDSRDPEALELYSQSASRLASVLLLRNDYEATLKVALNAMQKLQEAGHDSVGDFASLLTSTGCCQLQLGMPREAANSFERAYQKYQTIIQKDGTDDNYKSAIIAMINATTSCLSSKYFEEAKTWGDRMDSLVTQYATRPTASGDFIDKERARVYLYRATALQGLGHVAEAAEAYRAAQATNYLSTGDGHIEANEYLMAAHRWKEAALNFQDLDKQYKKYNIGPTYDNIIKYKIPKFRANLGAGLKDTVVDVGVQICDQLDSAVIIAKKNDAAELAIIYDTHEKEAEIARQQAAMSRMQLISFAVAMVLIIVFFVIYTLHRRTAIHHLAAAHIKLQAAYDKLEETTAAKERFESELRIARDIQQSIVPSVFPKHGGLDLYACMQPAKAVGGDLYDYILDDDRLYICLGDVSGKGVPASLFMAQTVRLFRSMVKQHMMPKEIATQLNTELCEGNDNGMFVTMFVALVDLVSGRMDFCNAGHNPPVLAGHFIEMESNAPLGLWPQLDFVGEHIDEIRNKPFFLYSDGLNEAENKQQEQFGDDRLLEILRETKFDNAQHAIEHMKAEVEKHRNGAEPNDDMTMMCLMVK